MLVFSLSNLPGILDTFITNYSPQTQPLARRSLPANALHRYAKFAHYRCDETWLAELMDGVIERIEEGAFVRLAYSRDLARQTADNTGQYGESGISRVLGV